MITATVKHYCDDLVNEFHTIPNERKILLERVTDYISKKLQVKQPVNLVYVCTHNSRRSHFGQIWAQTAANYYNIKNVHAFSGGTEATAFNSNAIHAIRKIGFEVKKMNEDLNPLYHIYFNKNEAPIECFSKLYNDAKNPSSGFAAIMTCGEAEENCPFIPGVELRIATTYDDPKNFDNTNLQEEKYDERCKQIAIETFYIFANLK